MIRVLLVDDEPQLLELARFFLQKHGAFAVETDGSAKGALERISQGGIDVVVSDYQMPDIDGLEFLKALRSQGDDIPFILFTGKGREDVAIEALNSGANFYIQKGGDPRSQFAELANMIISSVEKRKAQRELMESERRFRDMMANVRHAAVVIDEEGTITYCNDHLLRIMGYRADELIGRNMFDTFFPPGMRSEVKDRHKRVMTREESLADGQYETLMTKKDGSQVLISWDSTVLMDHEGHQIGSASIGEDITQKRIVEEELIRSESRYRRLVVTAPCLICGIRPSGETIFVNEYVESISGYKPDELVGRNWWDIFYPGQYRVQVEQLIKMFDDGDIDAHEMTLVAKDGTPRTVIWNSFNEWSETGELVEIRGTGLDVTARKQAEDALRESGAFNRAVLDSLDAQIAVLDSKGTITAVNRSWWMFARENGADIGKVGVGADYIAVCQKAAHELPEADDTLKGILSVLRGERDAFMTEYSADFHGEERWYAVHVTSLQRKRGGAVISHIDITNRRLAQKNLAESEDRYRTIFETARDSLLIADNSSAIILVNPEFERVSGYHRDDIEGKMNLHDFFSKHDVKAILDIWKKRVMDPSFAPQPYEFRAKDKFGNEKAFLATISVLPIQQRLLISLVDQTEKKYYEDALEQVRNKMDILAKITRHDILNQISVLYGYIDLAKSQTDEQRIADTLHRLYLAADSIKHHVEFARDYQNMGTKKPQWIDVRAACRRASGNLDTKEVQVIIELSDLEVFADPMMEKVFYNLIDNSIRHGERTTTIRFRFTRDHDAMRITCEDDGVGVPEARKEAIFDRDVKETKEQRGYGLYLAREILSITGMTISEAGTPGKGATFVIRIPHGKYRTKPTTRKRKGNRSRI